MLVCSQRKMSTQLLINYPPNECRRGIQIENSMHAHEGIYEFNEVPACPACPGCALAHDIEANLFESGSLFSITVACIMAGGAHLSTL